jgi:hypothetical protein
MANHMQNQLELAISIAVKAHTGQVDKAGEPYILHPLRVMAQLDAIEDKIVAVLHDVIEDTEVVARELREWGLEDYFVNAVKQLTLWAPSDSYTEYIKELSVWELCRRVKIADLRDNLQVERLVHLELTQKDLDRIKKYQEALKFLL